MQRSLYNIIHSIWNLRSGQWEKLRGMNYSWLWVTTEALQNPALLLHLITSLKSWVLVLLCWLQGILADRSLPQLLFSQWAPWTRTNHQPSSHKLLGPVLHYRPVTSLRWAVKCMRLLQQLISQSLSLNEDYLCGRASCASGARLETLAMWKSQRRGEWQVAEAHDVVPDSPCSTQTLHRQTRANCNDFASWEEFAEARFEVLQLLSARRARRVCVVTAFFFLIREAARNWRVALHSVLPVISWRGTCVKLKPFPTQASLTSLQFRARKSALAAMDSTQKVQMIVCSLSIVHFCENPYCFRLSAVSRLLVKKKKLPCSRAFLMTGRLMVATQLLLSTNTFPKAKPSSAATDNAWKSPGAHRSRLRVWRCHMNPGSAFPGCGASTSLGRRSPRSLCWSGNAAWRGSALCLDLMHWQGKAGHKIWSGIQPYPSERGLQVDTYHRNTEQQSKHVIKYWEVINSQSAFE